MKKRIFSAITISFVILTMTFSTFAHSGRTDSSGGHKDNKNKSGLGSYHYHCGGYPAHLHSGGVCPYKGGGTSTSPSISSSSPSSSNPYASAPKPVYATKVNIPNMPANIYIGESVKLNGSVYPSNAEDQSISWESSDPSIATVNSSGELKAVDVGTVTITAKTSRGTSSKFNLTVKEIEAQNITVSGKQDNIIIGETIALSVLFTPENTTYKDVEWKSEDESIARITQNGKLTASGIGKTTIYATHKNITDSFEIEVLPIMPESIEIIVDDASTDLKFKTGSVCTLNAKVSPSDTTDPTTKWSVNNTDIATIDENGTFTAIAEGTVVVKAETINNLTDTVEIEIYNTSAIVYVLSGIVVLLILTCIIGGPVFLIIWIKKKIKNTKDA